jgi:predicted AlkP superfamily pyrophosphatase or phosphodiesterase
MAAIGHETRSRMMLIRQIGLMWLGLLFALPGVAGDIRTVIVISIDALHPDALNQKTSPTLHALMQSGRHTLQGQSVDPPKTLVAHTAMVTGLPCEANGKCDNTWEPGQARLIKPTLFDDAKRLGYRTAFYYAKPKLGFLATGAVDEHALARDDSIERARAFFRQGGRRFLFLHVSGLEDVGTESGWLSPDYLDALSYIDLELSTLIGEVSRRGPYFIVVTSDHAGHGRRHGTRHPEDYRLPLIVAGDPAPRPLPAGVWHITELRSLLQRQLAAGSPRAMSRRGAR